MSLDDFFLTAPFATDDLKAQVEQAKNDLQTLQNEIATVNMQLTEVAADLGKMEEKTSFLEQEMRKALTVSTLPEAAEQDREYDLLKAEVYDPLNFAATATFAASGLFLTVGFLGGRYAGRAAKAGQAGGKLLGAASSGKNLATLAKAGKLAEASKFSKFMKAGKKLGSIGLGLAAVELGLRMKNAVEMNNYFKENLGKIDQYLKNDTQTLNELKQTVTEAENWRSDLLAEAGLDPKAPDAMDSYVRQLNQDIAAVGRDKAFLSSARRMLLSGMTVDLVEQLVPELSAAAVAGLAKKLQAERGLLDGQVPESITELTGLTALQVKLLQKLLQARLALQQGDTLEQVAVSFGLLEDVVEGLEETLIADRRSVWTLLAAEKDPAGIARQTGFSLADIQQFKNRIACVQQLEAGRGDAEIAQMLGLENRFVAECRQKLPAQKQQAQIALQTAGLQPVKTRPEHIAADLQLPIELVVAMAAIK
ncbi:hypothetical protein [Methylomonas methanica]|uniref:Uncharacterized protein n=1 Tax=Methylomonas methanica (strain DSM 25384 / MC09) TaxID=857087 RepID=G0A4L7_METMM|nr:hypothetical protein [Methylomonas methanica]AEG01608.1 hypothetical protein Metme_3235 [Methylomonas methanica MC09]